MLVNSRKAIQVAIFYTNPGPDPRVLFTISVCKLHRGHVQMRPNGHAPFCPSDSGHRCGTSVVLHGSAGRSPSGATLRPILHVDQPQRSLNQFAFLELCKLSLNCRPFFFRWFRFKLSFSFHHLHSRVAFSERRGCGPAPRS